uniref:TMV resistance protein N-like n=1 Tax=Panagrellus redivivus TaxID=6233 RepID=A0A7E4UY02_PANRE
MFCQERKPEFMGVIKIMLQNCDYTDRERGCLIVPGYKVNFHSSRREDDDYNHNDGQVVSKPTEAGTRDTKKLALIDNGTN